MKKIFISMLMLLIATPAFAGEKILVIREAKEDRKTAVSVEAYLIGNMLEAKVSARVERAKPKLDNVIVIGPGIDRVSATKITQVFATTEEEAPYTTTKRKGFISFAPDEKTKKIKGTVVRQLYTFKIPPEKIKPKGKYELWVKVRQDTAKKKGKLTRFKFGLDKLPELMKK